MKGHRDSQVTADYVYGLIYARFSKSFTMVKSPEPDTLHVAVAPTQLGKDDVAVDVISTAEAYLRAVTSLLDTDRNAAIARNRRSLALR